LGWWSQVVEITATVRQVQWSADYRSMSLDVLQRNRSTNGSELPPQLGGKCPAVERIQSGFRESRERAAQAEATATKAVSDAIEQGSAQAINYFIAQKYVEAVAEFARSPNAKTILFPVEATQLIGTLGGIAELTKEAIGSDGRAKGKAITGVPKVSE